MFSIIGKTNINFVGIRYIGFIVSVVLMLVGSVAVYRVSTGQARLSIDFSGGTNVAVLLDKVRPVEEVRAALKAEFPAAEIQQVADKPQYLVRIAAEGSEAVGSSSSRIKALVIKGFGEQSLKDISSEEVGPAVSKALRGKAFWAVFWALIAIALYIAFRFDLRFSVGAFVATMHDVLAVLGIMVMMDREFSLLTVTALLTLAGYSLQDTVVVFDRIRENMGLRRTEGFPKIVNDSINETLSRTLNTSMTTLLTLVTLYFLGGEVVRDFSLALILGIIVGTYSSIFVAAPLVVEWNLRRPRR